MESKRNRERIEMIRALEEAPNATEKSSMENFKNFDENIVAVTFKKSKRKR